MIPRAAFHGKTPDEVYFGKGDDLIARLAQLRADARLARLEANRRTSCADCYASAALESRMVFDSTHFASRKLQHVLIRSRADVRYPRMLFTMKRA